MSRRAITFLVVIVALFAGAVLKVGRYSDHADAASLAAETRIFQVMSAHGWSEASSHAGTIYHERIFSRPGCEQSISVAILSGNAEAASFFRLRHGGDAAFIQENVVDHPSGLHRQVTGMVRDVGQMFGISGKERLPVFAIAPAPVANAAECAGPPASAWRF